MQRLMLWLFIVTIVPVNVWAQEIAATWQGTMLQGTTESRVVLRLTQSGNALSGRTYLFTDRGAEPYPVSNVSVNGVNLSYSIEMLGSHYQGKISADGNSIVGNMTSGSASSPLTFVRATKETTWEIPPPPAFSKMPANADPSFEVATIKLSNSGASGLQFRMNPYGRNFAAQHSSFRDLMAFAYDVQSQQIAGSPAWAAEDRYEIAALTDQDGAPSLEQLKSMMRKLLADRFHLEVHHEKHPMKAYVLTVAKSTTALTPSETPGEPAVGRRLGAEGLTMLVSHSSMDNFASFLQLLVLDRPVVNETGLSGRYEFPLTFTPDDSQFNGHPPALPAATDKTSISPGLFVAIQQQLGLKLSSQEAPVDIVVIDHVEKPSPN